jgi:cold shock protein
MAIGVVKNYMDARGFGFIRPDAGGPDVFFHIKGFSQPGGEPNIGDRVEYEISTDPSSGRSRAEKLRFV